MKATDIDTLYEKFDDLREVAQALVDYFDLTKKNEVWPMQVVDLECLLAEIDILERKFIRERKNSEALAQTSTSDNGRTAQD
jgi:hypothetical protein